MPETELAKVELSIVKAVNDLAESMGTRIHALELRMETLSTTTQGVHQTVTRQLSDIERRIGGNAAAIEAAMDHSERVGQRGQATEAKIREEIGTLREEVRTAQAKTDGRTDGMDEIKKTITWGLGVIVAVLTLFGSLIALTT